MRRNTPYPATIRTDQDPEFTGRALDQWAFEHNVELRLIQPGKPTQNDFIESFNGRFRDECLNEHWFSDVRNYKRMAAGLQRMQASFFAELSDTFRVRSEMAKRRIRK